MSWNYVQPVNIVFGQDKVFDLKSVIESIGGKRGVLVSDPLFLTSGMTKKIIDLAEGLICDVYADIRPNPTVTDVDNCISLLREKDADFIVAFGGGSAMDCAKAASIIANTSNSIIPYHEGELKLPETAIPIIAIPTTSGTGSEVTSFSVLSNPDKKKKAPIASPLLYPKVAIIDPKLTITVPKQVTASTGLDVLSHALEGFWSIHHQPLCDAFALKACDLVFNYLERAYSDGNDIYAREKMCEASVLAGLSFALPKTTGPHACSYPLTSVYGLPHGEACAFTLDYFTRINAPVENNRLNSFAQQLGFVDAFKMADRISELKSILGMRTTLRDIGVKEEDIISLTKLSMHPNMLNNPVKMTETDVYDMYISMK